MKKSKFIAAAALFTLASCTVSDEVFTGAENLTQQQQDENVISFGTYVGKTGVTRASYLGSYEGGSITNEGTGNTKKLQDVGFGVFGYHPTAGQSFSTWSSWDATTNQANKAPNFMYNEKLTWSTTKSNWDYSPVKYWPNGIDAANDASNPSNTATEATTQSLSFFAYAPYIGLTDPIADYSGTVPAGLTAVNTTETASGYGIIAMSKNNQEKDVQLKYMFGAAATETGAVDLLWGLRGQKVYKETDNNNNSISTLGAEYNVDLTKQTVTEKVKFLFKHALARVGGSTSSSTSASGSQLCGLKVVVDVDKNSSAANAGQSNQGNFFTTDFNKAKTLVTIREVKIRDMYSYSQEPGTTITTTKSDFLTEGWFNIMKGTWSETSADYSDPHENGVTYSVTANTSGAGNSTSPYALNSAIKEGTVSNASGADWNTTNSGGATGVNLTAENVFADENVPGLLLIPGAGGNTIYITVDYIVRTADPKLSTGFSEVEQTITNKVTLDGSLLAPNKYYTLVMHLGLTSVKFEAIVADWSNGTNEYNEDGSETTGGTPDYTSVWLPSNVVEYTGMAIAASKTDPQLSLTTGHKATSVTATVYSDAACTVAAAGASAAVNGSDANKVDVTLPANETTKKKTYYVKVTDDNGTDGDTSDDQEVKFEIKQDAHALDAIVATYAPDLVNSKIIPAGAVVTLPIKVNGAPVSLTSAENVSDVKVTGATGVVVTKTSTGATIAVPANTTYSDRTISYTVKVNDASLSNNMIQKSAVISIDASASANVITFTAKNVTNSNADIDLATTPYTITVLDDSDAIIGATNYSVTPAGTITFTTPSGSHNYKVKLTIGDSEVTSTSLVVNIS